MNGMGPGSNRSRMTPRQTGGSSGRSGPHLGPLSITPVRAVVGIAFLGSIAFIGVAILKVRDERQIPMLSSGFAVLGLAFAAMALGAVIELWRAAAVAQTGRAVGLAIGGGIAGLAAIGCFTVTVVFALLWKS
jgi:hypothetical protein